MRRETMTDHPGGQLFDQRAASLTALSRHTMQLQRLAFDHDRSQYGRLSVGIRAQPAPGAFPLAFEFLRAVERGLQAIRVANVEPDTCDENVLAVCVHQAWNRRLQEATHPGLVEEGSHLLEELGIARIRMLTPVILAMGRELGNDP